MVLWVIYCTVPDESASPVLGRSSSSSEHTNYSKTNGKESQEGSEPSRGALIVLQYVGMCGVNCDLAGWSSWLWMELKVSEMKLLNW